MSSPSLLAEPN